MTTDNTKRDSGTPSGHTTVDTRASQSYDWSTTNSQQFIRQFDGIVGLARNAGVTEQQLLDSISQNYNR